MLSSTSLSEARELRATLTVHGSPWTGSPSSVDSQQFDIGVVRHEDGSEHVDMRSWTRPLGKGGRVRPVAVTLRPGADPLHTLSDGRVVVVPVLDTVLRRIVPTPPGARARSSRPSLAEHLSNHPAPARSDELLAPIERTVTTSVAARTRDVLTAHWGEGSRIDATRIRYSRSRGDKQMTVVFDERVGAIVQEELRTSDGATYVTHLTYVPAAGGYHLSGRERVVTTGRGTWRFNERIQTPTQAEGVR